MSKYVERLKSEISTAETELMEAERVLDEALTRMQRARRYLRELQKALMIVMGEGGEDETR